MIFKLFVSIFLFHSILFSQTEKFTQKDLNKFDWITGSWEKISERYSSFEMWEKINDSTFAGKSFTISGGDTVSFESIEIQLNNGEIFYIPTVRGQNENKPVYFKLISLNEEAIFENEEHDFPQRIIYRMNEQKNLSASIEGTSKGKQRRIDFQFSRSK
jgi:hypothetical protein